MALFPADMPRPEPDRDDKEFWEGCARRKLQFQTCGACGHPRHPPLPICPKCHSTHTRWIEAPERAVVYTYCVVHHPNAPMVESAVPYVVGVVEFPEFPGVRLVTNITGIDPTRIIIGMRVVCWWDDIGDGMFIPRFRPEHA